MSAKGAAPEVNQTSGRSYIDGIKAILRPRPRACIGICDKCGGHFQQTRRGDQLCQDCVKREREVQFHKLMTALCREMQR